LNTNENDQPVRHSRFEPGSAIGGKVISLQEQRDTIRLKKILKGAVTRDVAPMRLIGAIRAGIRA
jgi:hypothetical protein